MTSQLPSSMAAVALSSCTFHTLEENNITYYISSDEDEFIREELVKSYIDKINNDPTRIADVITEINIRKDADEMLSLLYLDLISAQFDNRSLSPQLFITSIRSAINFDAYFSLMDKARIEFMRGIQLIVQEIDAEYLYSMFEQLVNRVSWKESLEGIFITLLDCYESCPINSYEILLSALHPEAKKDFIAHLARCERVDCFALTVHLLTDEYLDYALEFFVYRHYPHFSLNDQISSEAHKFRSFVGHLADVQAGTMTLTIFKKIWEIFNWENNFEFSPIFFYTLSTPAQANFLIQMPKKKFQFLINQVPVFHHLYDLLNKLDEITPSHQKRKSFFQFFFTLCWNRGMGTHFLQILSAFKSGLAAYLFISFSKSFRQKIFLEIHPYLLTSLFSNCHFHTKNTSLIQELLEDNNLEFCDFVLGRLRFDLTDYKNVGRFFHEFDYLMRMQNLPTPLVNSLDINVVAEDMFTFLNTADLPQRLANTIESRQWPHELALIEDPQQITLAHQRIQRHEPMSISLALFYIATFTENPIPLINMIPPMIVRLASEDKDSRTLFMKFINDLTDAQIQFLAMSFKNFELFDEIESLIPRLQTHQYEQILQVFSERQVEIYAEKKFSSVTTLFEEFEVKLQNFLKELEGLERKDHISRHYFADLEDRAYKLRGLGEKVVDHATLHFDQFLKKHYEHIYSPAFTLALEQINEKKSIVNNDHSLIFTKLHQLEEKVLEDDSTDLFQSIYPEFWPLITENVLIHLNIGPHPRTLGIEHAGQLDLVGITSTRDLKILGITKEAQCLFDELIIAIKKLRPMRSLEDWQVEKKWVSFMYIGHAAEQKKVALKDLIEYLDLSKIDLIFLKSTVVKVCEQLLQSKLMCAAIKTYLTKFVADAGTAELEEVYSVLKNVLSIVQNNQTLSRLKKYLNQNQLREAWDRLNQEGIHSLDQLLISRKITIRREVFSLSQFAHGMSIEEEPPCGAVAHQS